MLETVLEHLNNWFLVPKGVHYGKFEVVDEGIVLPFLKENQYFRVVGSIFNDGLHKYPATDMVDEEFEGEIWALAVPPSVIALASEIEEWCSNNPESQYVSENFNGYSYSTATNPATGAPMSWQGVFRSRLNKWRKLR